MVLDIGYLVVASQRSADFATEHFSHRVTLSGSNTQFRQARNASEGSRGASTLRFLRVLQESLHWNWSLAGLKVSSREARIG